MKKIGMGIMLALAVLLAACGKQTVQEAASRALEIDASAGEVLHSEDSHGGFHGDGTAYAVLQFEDGAVLEQIQESAKAFRTMEEWFRFTDEYGRNLREQQRQRSDERREGISLMTMHSAKGLEFDTVFILGANEGVTPYKKAKLEEEIEEERRMFYVAMTRAKEKLVITYVKTKNGKDADPSRFVEELLLRGKKKKDA